MVGCGIHRWYQLKRQAFKLFNEYAGFCNRACPLFGRANVRFSITLFLKAARVATHATVAIAACEICRRSPRHPSQKRQSAGTRSSSNNATTQCTHAGDEEICELCPVTM